jgi:carbonic anhydrase
MSAIVGGREKVNSPNLRAWLRHGETAMARLDAESGELTKSNQLSQQNVLQQLENLHSYPVVRERLAAGRLRLHAWWFELRSAEVYSYEEILKRFVLIDENEAAKMLSKLS